MTGRAIPKTKYYKNDGTLRTDDPNLTTLIDTVQSNMPDAISANKDPNKSVYNEDVNDQELKITQDLMDSMTSNLGKNTDTIAIKMSRTATKNSGNSMQVDINERYTALKNRDKDSFKILQNRVNELRFSKKKVSEMTDDEKTKFVTDFIKQKLSLFGKDQNSGENIFQLPEKMQRELIESLTTEFTHITDDMSILEQSQWLAKMDDMIMNKISEGQPNFVTEIDNNGNYTTTTTSQQPNGQKIKLSSKIDKDGNPVERSFTVGDVQFRTTFDKNGWFYGKSKNNTTVNIDGQDTMTLTPMQGDVLSCLWMQHKAIEAFAMTAKLTGWGLKQVGVNVVGMHVTVGIPPLAQAALGAVLLCVVKLVTMIPIKFSVDGYQVTGHDFWSPAAKTAISQFIKYTVGDEGQIAGGVFTGGQPLMSGNVGKVFRDNTMLTGDNANASFDNTYFNPIVDVLTTASNIVAAPFKAMFPQLMGDQMFSSAEIASSQAKATSLQLSA